MKIARVYSNFQVDLKYTEHYLARELSKKGHQTTFITSDKYLKHIKKYITTFKGKGFYKYDHFNVYRIKSMLLFEKTIFINIKKINRLLFKSNFDVLHLYGVATFSSLLVLWLYALNKSKTPIIISDHTDTRTHVR